MGMADAVRERLLELCQEQNISVNHMCVPAARKTPFRLSRVSDERRTAPLPKTSI